LWRLLLLLLLPFWVEGIKLPRSIMQCILSLLCLGLLRLHVRLSFKCAINLTQQLLQPSDLRFFDGVILSCPLQMAPHLDELI